MAKAEQKKVTFRHPYSQDSNEVSRRTGLACTDKSRAIQSQKEQADINTIVKQFGLTGKLPENVRMPSYGDFTGISDYQTALNQVIQAENEFMKLPVSIRERFNHDPQALLEFISDNKNREEAIKLGLVTDKPKNEPAAQGGVPPTGVGGKTDTPMAKTDKTGT